MQTDLERKTPTQRMYFLDSLRVFLTILVIFHHIAVTYGSSGSWYYIEHTGNHLVNEILGKFTGFNQMYFMGLFFLISGYFTPASLDRKGTLRFLKDRLIRLGIPLFLFFFTLSPYIEYVKDATQKHSRDTFWEFYKFNILRTHNLCPGPLWFVETLLVFSLVYVLWRGISKLVQGDGRLRETALTNGMVTGFILFLTLFTFAGRIPFPTGIEHFHLQLGYFPQYISLFIIGIIAYRKNWIAELPERLGKVWIRNTMLFIFLVGLAIMPLLFGVIHTTDNSVHGGFTWQSLLFSFYESFGCVGMCIVWIYIFRKRANSQKSRLSKILAENAYTVYIIHAPIVVILARSIRDMALSPFVKFLGVSVTGTILCYLVSYLVVMRIPYARRAL